MIYRPIRRPLLPADECMRAFRRIGVGCGVNCGGGAETNAKVILGPACVAELRSDQAYALATGVSAWADMHGSGVIASQSIPAKQGAYGLVQTPNGKPAITVVAAAGQYLKTSAFTLAQPVTVFLCARWRTGAVNALIFDGYGYNSDALLRQSSDGKIRIQNGTTGTLQASPSNTWIIYRCVFAGASSSLAQGSAAPAVTTIANTALGGFTIGGSGSGTYTADADISHAVIALGDVTLTTGPAVVAYMAAWNGVSV